MLKANSLSEGIYAELVEYSINDHLDDILGNLYSYKSDVYAFSCYIWNIEQTLKVVNNLKQVQPCCTIVLGGPEVTFNGREVLQSSSADIVVKGEGEIIFKELLLRLKNHTQYNNINGIVFKEDNLIVETENAVAIKNMDNLIFAYQGEDMTKYKNQILYYEGSRGCPFNCSYCLSSIDKTISFHSINRVKNDLLFFIQNNVKQVKFVDRTFNSNLHWAKDIISFLIDHNNGVTNFHFEIAADLLDDEIIQLLNTAPVGLFQLEIGVQSVNEETLTSINRKTSIEKIEANIKQLRKSDNIHLHVDLIAGLPYEDLSSFKISFNRVFHMQPHMLQLGFLKLLKGSPIEMDKDKFNFKFIPYPPYEVLSNDFISYEELLHVKKIEHLVDRYNNSGSFKNTITYIINTQYSEPFIFFEEFVQFWNENNLFKIAHNKDKIYEILLDFTSHLGLDTRIIQDLIKLDYLTCIKLTLPTFIPSNTPSKEEVFEILKNESFKTTYLPQHTHEPAKKLYKNVHIEIFEWDIIDINNTTKKNTVLMFYKSNNAKLDQINDYVKIDFPTTALLTSN